MNRDQSLKTGIKHTIELTVTPEDTAASYGSGDLEVLATPALVAFMENAALNLASPFLKESESTVGTEISVKHIKATALGKRVTCTANLKGIDGNRLTFEIKAYEGEEIIGFGDHTRYIIDVDRFMRKLAN